MSLIDVSVTQQGLRVPFCPQLLAHAQMGGNKIKRRPDMKDNTVITVLPLGNLSHDIGLGMRVLSAGCVPNMPCPLLPSLDTARIHKIIYDPRGGSPSQPGGGSSIDLGPSMFISAFKGLFP